MTGVTDTSVSTFLPRFSFTGSSISGDDDDLRRIFKSPKSTVALLVCCKETFVVGVFLPASSVIGLAVLRPFRVVFCAAKNSGLFAREERGVVGSDTEPLLDSLIQ